MKIRITFLVTTLYLGSCYDTNIKLNKNGEEQLENVEANASEIDPEEIFKDKIIPDPSLDTDGDGISDLDEIANGTNPESADTDGDGVPDAEDDFPNDSEEHLDSDVDGIGNNQDSDDDNDGLSDLAEIDLGTDPLNPDTDGDGVIDPMDALPMDPTEQSDFDGDGIGDNLDPDDDNDGSPDVNDLFPFDPKEFGDLDGDGIGDNSDPDIDGDGLYNAEETALGTNLLVPDTDGDGMLDSLDAFPLDPSEWLDTDGDGFGNNTDLDDDNDGISDIVEQALGTNPLLADTDGDGVIDGLDAFPLDPSESLDADGDGIGDFTDPDDDNDGVPDLLDLFPYDGTESADIDADGIGDNADTDDDNDGSPDGVDLFPLDPSEWMDSDSDGTGDNADTDDDNDGVVDALEITRGTNPYEADSDGDGTDDFNDPFGTDNTRDRPTLTFAPPTPGTGNQTVTFRFDMQYEGANAVNLGPSHITLDLTGGVTCTEPVTIVDPGTLSPEVYVTGCVGDGTVGITVAAGRASFYASSDDGGSSATASVDNTPPNVTIGAPSATVFNPSGTVSYTLTYDFAPTSLDPSDISIGGDATDCVVTVDNETTINPVVNLTGCSVDGAKTISVAGGTSEDPATNPDLGAGPSDPTTLDTSAPTVNIAAPSASPINSAGTVSFDVTYSGDDGVYDLQLSDITVDTTGGVTCDVPVINSGNTASASVDITNCSGDGTVGITVGADTVRNPANTPNVPTSSLLATVDNTAAVVTISSPSATEIRSASSVTFELTYENPPASLIDSDVTVNGDSAGCIASVSDAATTTPDVTVSGCTADGSITISVAAGESADDAGNPDLGAGPSDSVTVDNTPPNVVIGAPSEALINLTDTVTFELTYEETPVSLVPADITVNGDSTGCLVTITDPATLTPDVNVTACSDTGSITISVAAGKSTDSVGNPDLGAGPSASVTVDNTAPAVSIGAPDLTDINAADTVTFTVTYEVAPADLTAGDITVGGANTGCSVAVVDGSTTTPDVQVSGCSDDGSITISVAAGESVDAAGNLDLGAGPSASVTVDNTPPTLTIGAPNFTDANAARTVTFILFYEEAPSSLVAGDITVNGNNTDCAVAIVDPTSTTPNVQVSGCSDDGSITISVAPGKSQDTAGNLDLGAGPSDPVTVDNTLPVVTIGAPDTTLINSVDTVTFELTYEEAPSSLVAGDITVNGNSTDCAVAIVDAATTTPDVQVSGCSDNGSITISIAAGESQDAAGNLDAGAGPSASVTVDNTAPTVTIGAPSVSSINVGTSVTFELTYEEAPAGLVTTDITVNGDSASCTVGLADETTTTPDVTISDCSANGSITISLAGGRSSDAAGNVDLGAGPSASVTVDNGVPTVNISAPSATDIVE